MCMAPKQVLQRALNAGATVCWKRMQQLIVVWGAMQACSSTMQHGMIKSKMVLLNESMGSAATAHLSIEQVQEEGRTWEEGSLV